MIHPSIRNRLPLEGKADLKCYRPSRRTDLLTRLRAKERNQNRSHKQEYNTMESATQAKSPKRDGYIYLYHAIGTPRYKIGRSVQPIVRVKEIEKQSPYPLEIIASFWTPDRFRDEAELHRQYDEVRVHGEWFELDQIISPVMTYLDLCKTSFECSRPVAEEYVKGAHRYLSQSMKEVGRDRLAKEFKEVVTGDSCDRYLYSFNALLHKAQSPETFQQCWYFCARSLPLSLESNIDELDSDDVVFRCIHIAVTLFSNYLFGGES